MKKIAILQSNYIPWKGYFDIINLVDEFVLYDTEQYTRRDWRNRNKIKTPNGLLWLTIPVEAKGKYFQKIQDTKVSNRQWTKEHWKTIFHNYSKAQYFKEYKEIFENLYLNLQEEYLSLINYKFITTINQILNINTPIRWSREFHIEGEKSEKLVSICKQLGATHYLSGPSAKNYLDEELFSKENIQVEWMDYSGYPEYNQLYPPFVHEVSIIDLIFNEGPNAPKYMKSLAVDENLNILEKLKSLKPLLKEKFGIEELAVFGSYTRNENLKESDLDITILKMQRKNGLLLVQAKNFLENNLNCKVDIGHYDSVRPFIKKRIEKDLLYV